MSADYDMRKDKCNSVKNCLKTSVIPIGTINSILNSFASPCCTEELYRVINGTNLHQQHKDSLKEAEREYISSSKTIGDIYLLYSAFINSKCQTAGTLSPIEKRVLYNIKNNVAMIKNTFISIFNVKIEDMTSDFLYSWCTEYLKHNNIRSSSLNRKVTALRSMFKWAYKTGCVEKLLIRKFHLVKNNEEKPYMDRESVLLKLYRHEYKVQTSEHCQTLLFQQGLSPPDENFFFADYTFPFIFFYLSVKCRKVDIINLKWENINFNSGTVYIQSRKSEVKMNSDLIDIMDKWRKQSLSHFEYLPLLVFPSPYDISKTLNKSSPSCWRYICRKYES